MPTARSHPPSSGLDRVGVPVPNTGHDRVPLADAYREHRRAVHALARRLCGPAAADDITQDVFLKLWRRPEAFDPSRGSLRAFLLAITRHRAVDVLRADASRRDREQRVHRLLERARPDVEHEIEYRDSAAVLRAALAALPGVEREAIEETFYAGRTYRQAAAVLGEPEGTIKSRIRTGMRRLAADLGIERELGPVTWTGAMAVVLEEQSRNTDGSQRTA